MLWETDEALSQIIERHGGLVDPDELRGLSFFPLVEYLLGEVSLAENTICTNHRLELGILKDTSTNAFAYTISAERGSFIGLNIGTFSTVRDSCLRIFCDPDAFRDIGDPSLEKLDRARLGSIPQNVALSGDFPVRPNCPVRFGYAYQLFEATITYIVLHEIVHVANGHYRYMSEIEEADPTKKSIGVPPRAERHLKFQAMEVDADCAAVGHFFALWGRLSSAFHRNKDELRDEASSVVFDAIYGDWWGGLRQLSIASYLFFRSCNCLEWDMLDAGEKLHPDPPLRSFIYMLNVHARVATEKAHEPRFLEIIGEAISEVEASVGRLYGLEADARGIKSVINNPALVEDHLSKVRSAWSEIRPRLMQLKLHERDLAP